MPGEVFPLHVSTPAVNQTGGQDPPPFCEAAQFTLLSIFTSMPNKVQFEGRPVWAEVDLRALAHNLRSIRRRLATGRKSAGSRSKPPQVLAVVKANAYGHGAVPVARALAKSGADWFGVTCSAEGIELREGGVRNPILLLTGFWEGEEKRIIQHNLTPAVTRCEQLLLLERAAARARLRKPFSFHLKIDSGMNRLGISPSDVPCFAKTLAELPAFASAGHLHALCVV